MVQLRSFLCDRHGDEHQTKGLIARRSRITFQDRRVAQRRKREHEALVREAMAHRIVDEDTRVQGTRVQGGPAHG